MSTWTTDELDRIGTAEELEIAPANPDGSPGRPTTIWVVRVGDDLFVRSYRGPAGNWYRHATATGYGHIRAGGVERDVRFETDPRPDPSQVDAAYRSKYAKYAGTYVPPILAPDAQATTLRLQPR